MHRALWEPDKGVMWPHWKIHKGHSIGVGSYGVPGMSMKAIWLQMFGVFSERDHQLSFSKSRGRIIHPCIHPSIHSTIYRFIHSSWKYLFQICWVPCTKPSGREKKVKEINSEGVQRNVVDRYVRRLIINWRGKWNFGQGINESVEDKQLILLEAALGEVRAEWS